MDFSDKAKLFSPFGDSKRNGVNMAKDIPSIFGIVKSFDPVINEIHIFKGEDGSQLEAIEEANNLQQKIRDLKSLHKSEEYKSYRPIFEKLMQQGIPIVPFPNFQRCLGLTSRDSSMEIMEGYAVLAYDFKVQSSH